MRVCANRPCGVYCHSPLPVRLLTTLINEHPCLATASIAASRLVWFRKSSMSPQTQVAYDFSKLWFTGQFELLQGMSQEAAHRFNSAMRRTRRRRGEWVYVHGD